MYLLKLYELDINNGDINIWHHTSINDKLLMHHIHD